MISGVSVNVGPSSGFTIACSKCGDEAPLGRWPRRLKERGYTPSSKRATWTSDMTLGTVLIVILILALRGVIRPLPHSRPTKFGDRVAAATALSSLLLGPATACGSTTA